MMSITKQCSRQLRQVIVISIEHFSWFFSLICSNMWLIRISLCWKWSMCFKNVLTSLCQDNASSKVQKQRKTKWMRRPNFAKSNCVMPEWVANLDSSDCLIFRLVAVWKVIIIQYQQLILQKYILFHSDRSYTSSNIFAANIYRKSRKIWLKIVVGSLADPHRVYQVDFDCGKLLFMSFWRNSRIFKLRNTWLLQNKSPWVFYESEIKEITEWNLMCSRFQFTKTADSSFGGGYIPHLSNNASITIFLDSILTILRLIAPEGWLFKPFVVRPANQIKNMYGYCEVECAKDRNWTF